MTKIFIPKNLREAMKKLNENEVMKAQEKTEMSNQNKIKICPKCNAVFEIDIDKIGTQFKFCPIHRGKYKVKKHINCLYCNKPLIEYKRTKNFCGEICEFRYKIEVTYKSRKLGCLIKID